MDVTETLRELAQGFANAAIGNEFFKSLARYLAKALAVDYVFIGEFSDQEQSVGSLVFYAKGQLVENISYPVVGSLCEYVVKPQFCAFPSGVQKQFPDNQSLKDFGVDSYVGIPLCDVQGKAIGLIYLMHSKAIYNLDQVKYLLNIVARRAELELERKKQEEMLQASNKRLLQLNEELTYAQLELKEANHQLEKRVAQRTQALAMREEELRIALKQQQALNTTLTERESFLSSIVNQTNVGIAYYEINGRFNFANEGYCRIVGRSMDELLTKTFKDITHPEDLPANVLLIEQLTLNGQWFDMEKRYLRPDGTFVWCLVNVLRLQHTETQIPKILAICQDITERKQAEAALIQTEERFQLISKATNDAIWDWDLHTDQLWWNEGFQTMFGYKPEAIKSNVQFWYELLHPDDRDQIINGIQEVIENGGKQWSAEYRFRKADGSYADVLDRAYVLHDENGKPYRMLGSMLDLTRQKENEKAIKKSEAQIRLILESMPHLSWTSPPGSSINYFNKHWYDYTGLTEEQSLGMGWQQALHPDDLPVVNERRKTGRSKGEPYEIENRYRRASDGNYRWHLGRVVPIYDDQGNITLWVGTATDIHDQKITQYTLENTLKELHEKNYELDQFVYKTSHDLRAPLTTVMGLVTVLKQERNEATKMQYVDLIENRVHKLDNFIKSMLDYSRNTRTVTRHENINIETLLQECIGELEYMRHYERLHIDLQIEEKFLYTDLFRLKIIFSNLVSNAIKYQDFNKDESKLTIQTKPAGEQVMICFSDNGLGIDQVYQDRIFSMFFRAVNQSDGSGLGLYIVKQAVSVLNGSIHLESQTGAGTKFIIHLPKNEEIRHEN